MVWMRLEKASKAQRIFLRALSQHEAQLDIYCGAK